MLLTFEMSNVGEGQDEATLGGAGVLTKEDPGPAAGEAWRCLCSRVARFNFWVYSGALHLPSSPCVRLLFLPRLPFPRLLHSQPSALLAPWGGSLQARPMVGFWQNNTNTLQDPSTSHRGEQLRPLLAHLFL